MRELSEYTVALTSSGAACTLSESAGRPGPPLWRAPFLFFYSERYALRSGCLSTALRIALDSQACRQRSLIELRDRKRN